MDTEDKVEEIDEEYWEPLGEPIECEPLNNIDPSLVPEDLVDLIPLANKWGASFPSEIDFVEKHISKPELQELEKAVSLYTERIEDWRYQDPDCDENDALNAMVGLTRVAMELGNGAGFTGELWWLVKQCSKLESPGEDLLLRLKKSLEWTMDIHSGSGISRDPVFKEARKILKESR